MKIKNIIYILGLLFVLKSNAQTVSLPPESLENMLCKKWEVDYVLMGNTKVGRGPGVGQMEYEFFKNGTYIWKQDSDQLKGSWEYNKQEKLIKVLSRQRSNASIVSLTADEFIMIMTLPPGTSPNMGDMKIVFKAKK
jgi:hypothetical protein